jgi:NDP-sugar pyrophosphorylase family protein
MTLDVDTSRPSLLTIGNHVFLHKGLTIMTHDWASWVFLDKYSDFIPSHGKVCIGDNVWFGENVTVLKGVTIGCNCIIGAGSIVTKNIPDNSIAVGIPCKVVNSLDNYYEKRKKLYPDEALEYLRTLSNPSLAYFYDDYTLFVDRENIQSYKEIPFLHVFKTKGKLNCWLNHHKRTYDDFNQFIESMK